MAQKMLFPPYLNFGSSGAAVDFLHSILCAKAYGGGIVRDGEYGEATADAVRSLQRDLGFTGDDVDGNFGPATRAALKAQKLIDVGLIPGHTKLTCETVWINPDTGESETWYPCAA